MKVSHGSGQRPRVPRILAVDDRRANLLCVQAILEPQGYEVVIETSGRRALTLCASMSFDLILLDVMMPEMDGVEVATRLREHATTREIPIVFLTAVPETVATLPLPGGAVEVISKPFEPDLLCATAACLLLIPLAKAKAKATRR